MSANTSYPATRFAPPRIVDLGDPNERARLSQGAIKAFFNIIARWKVRDEDARLLLGGVSNGLYYAMKKAPGRRLDQDTLTRISYLIGVFKALHILYGEELADRWMQMPNQNPIFNGRTPLATMIQGGLPAFQSIRRLLDARRGGA